MTLAKTMHEGKVLVISKIFFDYFEKINPEMKMKQPAR